MSRTVRKLTAAVAILVLTATLAACGGIPTSGGVQAGDQLTNEPTGDFIFNPLGPSPDADQRAILDGFIAAFTGPQSDYSVAREYLSSDLKKEWDPRQSVLIRTGSPTITQVDSATMDYSFTPKAQLDEFGAYSQVSSAVQTLRFQFVKENDQWRISQAPPGIVLPESTFLSIFSKHALYFYDLSLRNLVPDERWFAGGTTATRIVTALLEGPPEWLKGAVVSQFPDGTQLTPGTTVAINSTVAQVDLTSEAASADERQRQLMQLQLSESLVTVPGIGSVEVSVGGSVLAIKPIGSDSPVVQRPLDSRPVVLADGKFGYLSGGEVSPISNLADTVVGLAPRAVAVGEDATAAAVLSADGVFVVRAGQSDALKVDSRAGLIAPSLDDFGYIWTVPKDSPNQIIVYDYEGAGQPVSVSLPVGSSIVSLDIAQDNTRVAFLLHTAVGSRIIVAAIVRDPSRGYLPTSIGSSVLDVVVDSGDAVDAAWIDRFSVATLTDSDDGSIVNSFEVGGQRVSLGRPAAFSVTIVGGNGKTGLRVLGIDHLLEAPRGSSWQATTFKVDLIATQR
jgi:Sporulation and spore germination